MDISSFRNEYLKDTLHRKDLDPRPMAQFEKWFKQAVEVGVPEPNAISLATVDELARPSLRTVLVKYFDERGFVFFTNYESRKAHEMSKNDQVSIMFPWLTLERQVIVCGTVSKITKTESLKYFLTRPRNSQLGAWVSHQSSVVSSRKLLEMKLMELKRKFSEGEVPLPSFWGGYRVEPRTIEFWQGGPGRVHDRFQYTRQEDNSWNIERLAP